MVIPGSPWFMSFCGFGWKFYDYKEKFTVLSFTGYSIVPWPANMTGIVSVSACFSTLKVELHVFMNQTVVKEVCERHC